MLSTTTRSILPQLGAYYAQQRGIDPANIVHVRVPDSYFISWDDFRRLRDQLIRFMQPNTLDDPTLQPVVCTDGEPPYYCQAAMEQLRTHTRIRYLVTTRGVPTRMTVDGSTLFSPTHADLGRQLSQVLADQLFCRRCSAGV